MAVPQWFCFVIVVCIIKICYAQCVIRTFVPMTVMDQCQCPTPNCEDSSSTSADDLNALLLLARALEMDRASIANNGIDVNGLLNTLINALVYTATQNSGKEFSTPPVFNNIDNTKNLQSSSQTIQNNSQNSGTSTPSDYRHGPYGRNDDGLIDLQLLGGGKDNVAKLDLGRETIVGLGLGSKDGGRHDSGLSGLLGGVLGK